MLTNSLLPNSFFNRTNVVQIARELLGYILVCQNSAGIRSSGIIVETEAYNGITDKASHAYGGRHTNRTSTLYQSAGTSYVYLCYGIHHLFNIVTNAVGIPHAVLIRALQPLEGIDLMLERRNLAMPSANLARGPGSAAKAMGINLKQNGLSLSKQNNIWIERPLNTVDSKNICAGPRIGVNYAAEDALLPYRFWIKGNACVSKK